MPDRLLKERVVLLTVVGAAVAMGVVVVVALVLLGNALNTTFDNVSAELEARERDRQEQAP